MSLPNLPKSSFLNPELRDYITRHSTAPDNIQQKLIEETKQLGDIDIMRVPPEQGALLTIISRLMKAEKAIEIGTFTGYSALCIARGLPADGQLITIDSSEEWTSIAKKYWEKARVADKIELKLGNAIDTLKSMPEEEVFDLAFIDADKTGYIDYYEEIMRRLKAGGIILLDNALWFGTVADKDTTDETALIMQKVNEHIRKDNRVEQVMLPIADGILVVQKRF